MSYALVAVSICMTEVLHILLYLLDLSDRTTGHLPSCWLSHPFDSFLIKEIRQIDKTSNIPCTNHRNISHGAIIFLRGLIFFFIITTIQEIIDEPPIIPSEQETQLSYLCLSLFLLAPADDRDFRSGAYSAKQNSGNMLERATRVVDLCKWICGTRWEVDFWRARLRISLSAGFWQIIGCWGFWENRT